LAEGEIQLSPEIERMSDRLAKNPRSLIFASLADAYRKCNLADLAIEVVKDGLEIHPDYASAYIVLGRCYQDKKLFELAMSEYEHALELDPDNLVVLRLIGDLYLNLGDKGKCIKTYRQLLDLDPSNGDVEVKLEELERGDTNPPASENKLITENPGAENETNVVATADDAEPSLSSATIAELYIEQGHLDEAIEIYRQILVREPDNERAQRRLEELEQEVSSRLSERSYGTELTSEEAAFSGGPEGGEFEHYAHSVEAGEEDDTQSTMEVQEEDSDTGDFKRFLRWLESLDREK
jgi:tetratricopeptide (TPR) repeat protein